jgi:hypothetical protein
MTLILAEKPVEVASAAEAYQILRAQGLEIAASVSPDAADFALWRRRVNDLISLEDPTKKGKDFLHPKLQAALLKLEDEILLKHPTLK